MLICARLFSRRVYERQEPSSETWSSSTLSASSSSTSTVISRLVARVEDLSKQVHTELRRQNFPSNRIELQIYLNMRYNGTDSPLMVLRPSTEEGDTSWGDAFAAAYKVRFDFLANNQSFFMLTSSFSLLSIG